MGMTCSGESHLALLRRHLTQTKRTDATAGLPADLGSIARIDRFSLPLIIPDVPACTRPVD